MPVPAVPTQLHLFFDGFAGSDPGVAESQRTATRGIAANPARWLTPDTKNQLPASGMPLSRPKQWFCRSGQVWVILFQAASQGRRVLEIGVVNVVGWAAVPRHDRGVHRRCRCCLDTLRRTK